MVIRIILLLLLSTTVLHAQDRRIVFRVAWKDMGNDSTKIEVLTDNDSIPTRIKFSKQSPDTITLSQPVDNILYKFRLTSYRGTTPGQPSTPVIFYFDADRYFKLTRWIVPLSTTHCTVWMFNDSSMTMRNSEFADTTCVRLYSKLPPRYRVSGGARARKVNNICTLHDNGRNGCDHNYILSMWDSNVGPDCRYLVPGQKECTLLTTVMDYDSLFADRYTAEATCYNRPFYDVLTGEGCVSSGWVYPTGIFPGRWETSYNYVVLKP